MTKSIFTTRFKECYKEKGYTQQEVAEKLDISLNGLKHHLRTKNENLPPLDLLKKMSELLEVDVAYLLGEIDCKRFSQQTVYDATGLTEHAASLITKHSENYSFLLSHFINMFSRTMHCEDICSLIDALSFVNDSTITINNNSKEFYYNSAPAEKKVLKAKILDLFDNALDEMFYCINHIDDKASYKMCCQLLSMIEKEYSNHATDPEPLYRKVDYYLTEINNVNPGEFILLYTPRQIVHDHKIKQRLREIYLDNNEISD